MQYHVPSGLVKSSAAVTTTVPTSSGGSSQDFSPSSASVARPASASIPSHEIGAAAASIGVRTGSTGVAVGQGLLSGRRLVVRVAPPSTLFSGSSNAAEVTPALNLSAASVASGDRASDSVQPARVGHSSLAAPSNSLSLSPSSRPAPPQSTTVYGGGIVRISDLRRQGVHTIESGLRLTTLQGGSPAAVPTKAGGAEALRRKNSSGPLRDVFTHADASTRQMGRAGASTSASRGRRRGRRTSSGSNRGSRRGSSLEVALTEDGELCEYRWFTARGRRCFVYDGRTYKGTAAHRMWAKVKEVASQHERQGRRGAAVTPATTTTTTATASVRTQPYRVSARAAAATARRVHRGDALHSCSRSTDIIGLTSQAPLSEEWLDLMRELHVEGLTPPAASTQTATPAVTASSTPSSSSSHPPRPTLATVFQRKASLVSGSSSTQVVEITDSSSSSSSSETSSTSNSGVSDDSGTGDDASHAAPSLRWPETSYFSDESSGWSSTSSLAAPRSMVQHDCKSPQCRRRRAEPTTTPSQRPRCERATSTTKTIAPAAHMRLYNGVAVVEEDGWLYPADVYAAQKPHQQREDQSHTAQSAERQVRETHRPFSPRPSTEAYLNTFGLAALTSDDDVPLSDLFTSEAAPSAQEEHEDTLLYPGRNVLPPPPAAPNAAGIAVIVPGQGNAVPLRPSMLAPRTDAAVRGAATTGGGNAATVLRKVDDADLLDGFTNAELADMFVTGEEIGGVRYGA